MPRTQQTLFDTFLYKELQLIAGVIFVGDMVMVVVVFGSCIIRHIFVQRIKTINRVFQDQWISRQFIGMLSFDFSPVVRHFSRGKRKGGGKTIVPVHSPYR